MITREEDGYWIELHETVAVHHEEVFAALTTTAGLIRWFPVNVEIDLRPGGLIVFGWDATFKHRTSVAILDYDPGGTVVWDWCAAHHDIHAPLYWTVEPQVEEGSRIVLRQGPFRDDPDSLVAMAGEGIIWRWQLCNLRTVYEARLDMRRVRPL